jgi:hypothetical protein
LITTVKVFAVQASALLLLIPFQEFKKNELIFLTQASECGIQTLYLRILS